MDNAETQEFAEKSDGLAEADTLVMPSSREALQPAAQEQKPSSPEALQEAKPSSHEALQQPPAKPASQESSAESLDPKLLEAAVVNYAIHHKVPAADVTREMVEKQPGVFHWATVGQDTSARGPGAQAMKRALKWRPDLQQSYNLMLDSMKQEFRKAWCATKSFDFVTSQRTTSTSFMRRRDEAGKFVTRLQLLAIPGSGCALHVDVRAGRPQGLETLGHVA